MLTEVWNIRWLALLNSTGFKFLALYTTKSSLHCSCIMSVGALWWTVAVGCLRLAHAFHCTERWTRQTVQLFACSLWDVLWQRGTTNFWALYLSCGKSQKFLHKSKYLASAHLLDSPIRLKKWNNCVFSCYDLWKTSFSWSAPCNYWLDGLYTCIGDRNCQNFFIPWLMRYCSLLLGVIVMGGLPF